MDNGSGTYPLFTRTGNVIDSLAMPIQLVLVFGIAKGVVPLLGLILLVYELLTTRSTTLMILGSFLLVFGFPICRWLEKATSKSVRAKISADFDRSIKEKFERGDYN